MLKNSALEPNGIRHSLGEALRERRKDLGVSMQTVADEAGLSVGFISQVERGLTAPSLGSLVSIARVLDIPLSSLLDQPPEAGATTHCGRRPTYRVPGADLDYERVSTTFDGSRLHSVIIHEPPGHRGKPISHEGEEMLYVLAGAITAEIEGAVSVLRQGDSIHFDSRRTHSTWNHTDQPASILLCGTMDVFGDVFGDAPAPSHPDPIHKAPPDQKTHHEGRHHTTTGEDTT